jgi:hypothetical protein
MIIFKLTSRFDSFLWTFDDPAPLYLNPGSAPGPDPTGVALTQQNKDYFVYCLPSLVY